MNKISLFVVGLSKPKALVINFILLALLIIGANIIFTSDFTYLTQTFNYLPKTAYQLLNNIGESGRQRHFHILFIDILMVFLYTIFLIGANYATFSKFVKRCSVITLLTFSPLLLTFVQLLEIFGLMVILSLYPEELYGLSSVINILTIIKFCLTVICFTLPLIGLCGIIIKILRTKNGGE